MPLAPGTRVGPYEIAGHLGSGGMGDVYRARDSRLHRDVALKVLPDAVASDPDRMARFRREAQLLAALNHQNIAQIYGFEEAGAIHALALELVEGPTLAGLIAAADGRGLDIDDSLRIARQMALALAAAHEQGIVHRDLKPANVKVTDDGVAKVLDFGIAKAIEPAASSPTDSPTLTARATELGIILGTAAYMAPEQARGKSVDKRADVWAFGCVLYEMLTGRRPFGGDDVSETLAAVLKDEPDWTPLPPGVTAPIRALLAGCLRKDRRARIADMSTVLFVMDEPGALAPAAAAPIPAASGVPVRGHARPLWQRALPLAASAAAGAVLTFTALRLVTPPAPAPAVTRFAIELEDGQFTHTGRQAVAISPDGSRIAFTANRRIYLRALADPVQHPIPGAEDTVGVTSPVFSPDGQSIAFFSISAQALKTIGIGGGAVATLAEVANPHGMSWAGGELLLGQGSSGIWRVPAQGGPPERVIEVGDGEVAHGPHRLPGGNAILFTLASAAGVDIWDRAQVVVHDLASGRRTTIIQNGSDARHLGSGHLVYASRGVLMAARFDPDTLQVGSSAPVIEGVSRSIGQQTAATQFGASANGTIVYMPGPATFSLSRQDLAILDRQGAIAPLKLPPRPYEFPRVSPDGRQVVVGSDDGREAVVWVVDVSGASAPRQLTFEGRNRVPIWSGRGTHVAFQSSRDGELGIFWQRADGAGAAERLTRPEPGTVHTPESFSPDDRTLLFTVTKGAAVSLWTLSLPGKSAAPFAGVASQAAISAAFSPDGRWVAYSAYGLSTTDAYVEPFPQNGQKHGVPIILHPFWSRDGKELIGRPIGGLTAVVFSTSPSVNFGNPRELPAGPLLQRAAAARRNIDIFPDGRFVGTIFADGGTTGASSRLEVVQNWLEELKARVP
jgi:serine/threonine-protein kinase